MIFVIADPMIAQAMTAATAVVTVLESTLRLFTAFSSPASS
jgi:hypothetical protein